MSEACIQNFTQRTHMFMGTLSGQTKQDKMSTAAFGHFYGHF